MTLLAIFVGSAGAYLLVWAFNIRRAATAQRPRFSSTIGFQWGTPTLGLFFLLIGFGWAMSRSFLWGTLGLVLVLGLGALLIFHDQYTATIKILFDDFLRLKRENSEAADFDLLYSIVKSRKPFWTEDRVVEMCVGKDIKQLVLLLLLVEYQIHPINDMALYERLKQKVEKSAPKSQSK